MNKAVFLDRDGVINKDHPVHEYVRSWEEFIFLTDVFRPIRLLNENDFKTIVVTNQGGIAKGDMTREAVLDIHSRMLEEIERNGAHIDAVYFCPHRSSDNCYCKKPKPGMILEAAEAYDIDTTRSFMVGNSEADVLAGFYAGCKTILIQNRNEIVRAKPLYVAGSLSGAAEYILRKD